MAKAPGDRGSRIVAAGSAAAILLVAACGRAAPSPPPPGTDAAGDPLPAWAVARIGTARFSGPCAACAFSADETSVVAACDDGFVTPFDAETGRDGFDFPAHRDVVKPARKDAMSRLDAALSDFGPAPEGTHVAAFSRDGTRLVTGGAAVLRIWDVEAGTMLAEHVRAGDSVDAAFAPDGKSVRVADVDRLWAWDPAARTFRETPVRFAQHGFLGMLGARDAAVVRPPGAALVPSGALVIDVATGAVVTLAVPFFATGCGESPDGTRIALLGWRTSTDPHVPLVICDAATGASLVATTFDLDCWGPVAWSPDGSTVAVAGSEGVLLADAATLARIRRVPFPAASVVEFSDDGKRLLLRSSTGARILDLARGTEVGGPFVRLRGHGLRWSADGRRVAAPHEDGRIGLFDAASGAVVETLGEPTRRSPPTYVLDAEGRIVFVAKDAVPSEVANQTFAPIRGVARATGVRLLAFRWDDETAAVRDLDTGREVRRTAGQLLSCALSPSGRRLACITGTRAVVLTDVDKDADVATWPAVRGGAGPAIAVAEDLDRVVIVAGRGVAVLDAGTPKPIRRFRVDARWDPPAVAISDDGRRVAAVAGWDVVVWDVDADEEIVRLAGHRAPPGDLAFSPDGTRLVTSSADGTALVWALPAR